MLLFFLFLFLLGHPVRNQNGIKFDKIILQVNMHRLTESILCKSSSIKKLLHSNLELSIPVTRVTRHSPSLDLLIWVRDLDFSGSREVTGHVIILTFKELR